MKWLDDLVNFFSSILSGGDKEDASATPSPSPTPTPTPVPKADKYLSEQARGASLGEYYPAYPMVATKSAELEKEYNKPGLADLIKLIGFFESTLGRKVGKPFNYWGMAPQSSKFSGYGSDIEAIDKFGKHLSGQSDSSYLYPISAQNPGKPITSKDIDELYTATETHGSYNPSRDYADKLINIWKELGYE